MDDVNIIMISPNFSFKETISSEKAREKGIDNSYPQSLLPVIKNTANGMERVRKVLNGNPIHIDSWFRCLELNRLLKSKDTSQHIKGEAVDFICPDFGTPLQICKALISEADKIKWDQLILEHTWIHTSFCGNPTAVPRGNVLSLLATGEYAIGLTDKFGNPF